MISSSRHLVRWNERNPFYKIMQYSPFVRFRDLGIPTFLLTNQMRMPAGMMHMSNDIIYSDLVRWNEGNPFYKTMQYSLFAHFRDLGMPTFLLTDQMRMPAGMMHMSNDIIYERKLRDGLGTALSENPKAQDLKTLSDGGDGGNLRT